MAWSDVLGFASGTLGSYAKSKARSIVNSMNRWNISRRALLVLACALVVITLVQVLPQVDLLDTAFHLGTAPIVIHSQATDGPVLQSACHSLNIFLLTHGNTLEIYRQRVFLANTHEFEVLHHTFRC